ncbi:hypothetical protein LCGC14_0794170 [marine sediment metagenome]|uniref:Uncharacterized protein n=1 Tax=marine sediment metagenome TaxID=412755 RepID=A0A0F9PRJ8_9ZZZZ
MKTLVVLEGNCNGEGQQFKEWLEKNLPEDIQLVYRDNCSGVGGGLFDEDFMPIEDDNDFWSQYCNS